MPQPEIAEDVAATMGQRIQPTFGYYRQPNGWLTAQTVTRLEKVRREERGSKHLQEYGAFDMTPYVANHNFEGLFMFGGAKEMAIDQIIQLGFHLNPPMVPTCRRHITQHHRSHMKACWQGARPVEFPQLKGVPEERLQPYRCEFCPKVLPTPEARQQHQQVAHAKELNNMQAGKSLASALQTKTAPVAQDASALMGRIAKLEEALQTAIKSGPSAPAKVHEKTCGECQEVIQASSKTAVIAKLKSHKKKAHKEVSAAASG